MKKRLLFFFLYTLFWLVFFYSNRFIFLITYFDEAKNVSCTDLAATFWYGSRLDFSTVGYFLILPAIAIFATTYMKTRFLYHFLNIYTGIVLFAVSFLIATDLELYKYWGFRLDATPLIYFKTPGEMLASVSWLTIVKQIGIAILFFLIFGFLYLKCIAKPIKNAKRAGWKNYPVFLLLIAGLIVPIRGGFDVSPVNISAVYFHNNSFVNHASVNLVWNVFFSLTEFDKLNTTYSYFDNAEAQQIFDSLYQEKRTDTKKILKTDKPNIIIIILESFTGNVIKEISGREGITPNFSALTKEGIFFPRMYASGSRSHEGIAAILSGYPAQTNTGIVLHPKKSQKLGFISKVLKRRGYTSAFYYGGDLNFANLKSYFINGELDKVITKHDFSDSLDNSKWGVHDHYVFARFLTDINKSKKPFFYTLFTLSSHAPFRVPMETVIEGEDADTRFFNSVFYTDQCLGDFIQQAKQSDWWNNTLLILTADHGSRRPGNIQYHSPQKFTIPMLWLGGALAVKDTVINSFASQTDVPATLFSQLPVDYPKEKFRFSRNILADSTSGFSFYVFNDGFGFLSEDVTLVYDNVAEKYIINKGKTTETDLKKGKAILQILYNDFNKK